MTPPVGAILFMVCGISKLSLERLVCTLWPFLVFQMMVPQMTIRAGEIVFRQTHFV